MTSGMTSQPPDRPALPVPRGPRMWAVAFGRFWWDFLVGDTPELFVGALLVLGLIALLVQAGTPRLVPVITLPGLAIALLAATLVRARRRG